MGKRSAAWRPAAPSRGLVAGRGEMGARIRAHDWGQTLLGPIGAWPQSLRTTVELMLASGFACALHHGPDAILLYNDGWAALIGPRHPEALGRSGLETFAESWGMVEPSFERAWRGDTVTLADQPFPFPWDGVPRQGRFTLSYSPLIAEHGAVAGVLVTAVETTATHGAVPALRESDERQAFLLRLDDALRPLADSTEAQAVACRLLGEHLGVDRAYYSDIHEEEGVTVIRPDYARDGLPSLAGRYSLADFVETPTALRSGRPFAIADTATAPALSAPARAAYGALGIAAFASAPLVKAGTLSWTLNVASVAARAWTADDVALIQDVAERTWAAVERARAEGELRESEARFRGFAESSIDTLWIMDVAAGQLEYLSPAFERMWGAPRAEVLRDLGRWAALVHPEDRDRAARALPRAQAGETVVTDYRIVRPADGAVRWINDTGFPIYDERGRVARVAGIAQDTTARKRAEVAIQESEARFRAVADLVPDLLWRNDPTGHTDWYNRRWLTYTGQTLDEAVGDGWLAAIHPDDRARVRATFQAAVDGGAPLRQEHRIRRAADGAYRWFLVQAEPVRDEDGAIVAWYGAATDIHEQRAAREELERQVAARTAELAAAVEDLRASEARLRLLVEQIPAALWTTDADLRVTALGGAGVPALVPLLRAAIGHTALALSLSAPPEPGDADAPVAAHTALVAAHHQALTGASVGFDLELEGRAYEAHVEPLRDADGRIVGVIGVAHDVTERALLRLQDEFLALASHELRTPLTPILGYLQMASPALAAGDVERAARYVALATEQVRRFNALVGDLLDVGRMRGGKLRLERDVMDLGDVVRRACETARVEAGAQAQTVVLDAPDEAALVEGDAARLEQVVLNLLTNAIKHASGSATIAVRLRRDVRAEQAVLEVQDYGRGIAEADLPRLFSRFYQVERPDRPSRGGLGLGLYLVQELVEAHGGTVAVASTVGQSTTFTVRLPLVGTRAAGRDA